MRTKNTRSLACLSSLEGLIHKVLRVSCVCKAAFRQFLKAVENTNKEDIWAASFLACVPLLQRSILSMCPQPRAGG